MGESSRRPRIDASDASVIIVNWHQPEMTVGCIASLYTQSTDFSFEVILVENEARPGSDAIILERFPQVRTVRLATNEGFAGGVNAGLEVARGKYVILLNNDAIAEDGFLQAGIAHLAESAETVAAVAARVLLAGRYVRTATSGDPRALVDARGAGWLPGAGTDSVELVNSTGVEITRDVNGFDRDWLAPVTGVEGEHARPPFGFSGAAVFLRRAALDDVGVFDRRFFMYYEDLDLSWRLRLAGYAIEYEKRAVVRHRHAASSGHHSPLVRYHSMRNRMLTVLKNGSFRLILRVTVRTVGRMVRDARAVSGNAERAAEAKYLSVLDWCRLWGSVARLGSVILLARVARRSRNRVSRRAARAAMPQNPKRLGLLVGMPMLNLVPGGMGGTETYAAHLTRQLAALPEVEVSTILPSTGAGSFPWTHEIVLDGVRTGLGLRRRLAGIGSALLATRRVRRAVRRMDVVHYLFTALLPAPSRDQVCAVTLHDVQHLELPQLFTRADHLYRAWFYHRAARRADVVITISEFSKRTIVARLGIPESRVKVASLGVDQHRFTPNTGDREDFLLYPARGWAHKNHARLIKAVAILRQSRPSLTLVLTGGNLATLGDVPEWVDRRGLVSADELAELYHRAAALVYPSLYEGFGLPPLEAMASGCPVAASNAGSIPEVCGDAAVLFDPLEPKLIARGISEALDRSSELSARGIEHARGFTWERCRDRHMAIYREALGHPPEAGRRG